MPYHVSLEQKPGYLHAVVTGENSAENVAAYYRDVLQACREHQCYRVLVEERLEGPRLKMMDVFRIASEGSAAAAGIIQALAYVDVNAEGDLMQFAETVGVNRGIPVRLFATVDEAEQWISARGCRDK